MSLYLSKKTNKVFIVNYKCCYSTFENLKFINKLNEIYVDYSNCSLFYKGIDKDIILDCNEYDFYLVMRDPIKRVISFYKDKVVRLVRHFENFSQECNQLLLNFYNKNYLIKSFTISDLVGVMKMGYYDAHIQNQSILYHDHKNIIKKNINIIKMEEDNFNKKLSELIYGDSNSYIPKSNNTEGVLMDSVLSEDDIFFLKKYYDDDYKLYNNTD